MTVAAALGEANNVGVQLQDAVAIGPDVGATVQLGPGNDRAWVADRYLDGSSVLHGGPGDDVLGGGDGFDVLDGGPGADQMSGGAGQDTVSYVDRGAPVSATIGGPGGELGEATRSAPTSRRYKAAPALTSCAAARATTCCGAAVATTTSTAARATTTSTAGKAPIASPAAPATTTCPRSGPACCTGSTRRFYRVHLLCSSDLRPKCAGVVRLLTGGRLAGRARFAVRAGHVRTVSIELRAGARRRLVSA